MEASNQCESNIENFFIFPCNLRVSIEITLSDYIDNIHVEQSNS